MTDKESKTGISDDEGQVTEDQILAATVVPPAASKIATMEELTDGFDAGDIPFREIGWSKFIPVKTAPGTFVSFYTLKGLPFGFQILGVLSDVRAPMGFSLGYNPNETHKWNYMVTIEDEKLAQRLREADKFLKPLLEKMLPPQRKTPEYIPLIKEGSINKETGERFPPSMKFPFELDKVTGLPCRGHDKETGQPIPAFELEVNGVTDLSKWVDYKCNKEKKISKPHKSNVIFGLKQAYCAAGSYGISMHLTRIKILTQTTAIKNQGRFMEERTTKVGGVEKVSSSSLKRVHSSREDEEGDELHKTKLAKIEMVE